MRLPLCSALIIGLTLTAAYPALVAAAPSREDDVRAADADWAKNFIACDQARMKTLVSDDLTMVNTQGNVVNKESFLKTVASCPMSEAHPQDVKVRVYGDSAVVVGTLHYKLKGQSTTAQQVYNRMYVLQGGAWRLVSNGHTPVAPAAATANAGKK